MESKEELVSVIQWIKNIITSDDAVYLVVKNYLFDELSNAINSLEVSHFMTITTAQRATMNIKLKTPDEDNMRQLFEFIAPAETEGVFFRKTKTLKNLSQVIVQQVNHIKNEKDIAIAHTKIAILTVYYRQK